MRFYLLLMAMVCGSWLLPGAADAGTTAPTNAIPRVEPLVLKDLHNKNVSLDDFHGQALLVFFFTMWAKPCQEQLPRMVELQTKYGGARFTVVGISLDEQPPAVINTFVEKHHLNFPVLRGDLEAVRGFGGITAIPVTFAVDPNRIILQKRVGVVATPVLETDVQRLLEK